MNPRIDETALAAAGAGGPNPPPAERLRAAADYALNRSGAGQLILFGSAARGEFGPKSDFDFLAVHPAGRRIAATERMMSCTHPETGDEIDVLNEAADEAEKRRWLAGTVFSTIFAEGATISTAEAEPLVQTARDSGMKVDEMARKGRYNVDEAPKMLRQAGSHLHYAEIGAKYLNEWGSACKELGESLERSLKCVVIAHGSPFTYTHTLLETWDEIEKVDGKLPFKRNDEALAELTHYAGFKGYHAGSRINPEGLYREMRPVAEAAMKHAKKRVPVLLAERERKRAQTTAEKRDDDTPIRHQPKQRRGLEQRPPESAGNTVKAGEMTTKARAAVPPHGAEARPNHEPRP